MKAFFALLLTIFLFVAPVAKKPKFYGCNVVATTLLEVKAVTATNDFVNTGFALTLVKQSDDSQLSYDAQITYQFTESFPYGVLFQIRVKDENGIYIRAETGGRSVGMGAFVGNTIPLLDTTYDFRTNAQPLRGTYTYELWVRVGGGEVQIVPFESTVRVTEMPPMRAED